MGQVLGKGVMCTGVATEDIMNFKSASERKLFMGNPADLILTVLASLHLLFRGDSSCSAYLSSVVAILVPCEGAGWKRERKDRVI